MAEDEIKGQLRHWIVRRNGRVRADQIADDTLIIEQRIVSSLHAMELLMFIEELRGRPLRIEQIKPRMLQSISQIYQSFFLEGVACPTSE